MKTFFFLFFMMSSLFGESIIMPSSSYKASGNVTDIFVHDSKLYAATSQGTVDIFNIKNHKIMKTLHIEKIKDFMGDTIDAKIYSIDISGNNLLILSQAEQGYRKVYINKDGKNELIIPSSLSLSIAKAKFLDENTILLALLGDELVSYNIKKRAENWHIQVGSSKFSSFALNESKQKVALCDESGEIKIIATKNGALIKKLSGQNLDNVFQVDYKNNFIATAGEDRRAVVYDLKTNVAFYKLSNFLIYSVGLSPSGALVGYSSDENNNITVFNRMTKTAIGKFGKNKMTPTNILFLNEKQFFVSSDDKTINFYQIQ
ncbi:MAG: WD40 repeat domain-containing protein [Thiovulaceae bacterium]|nr:WD40 repeat domain-containing protein [Sulfurimonadaceae bacterium]